MKNASHKILNGISSHVTSHWRGRALRVKGVFYFIAFLPFYLLFASCIDEDLSRCGVNYNINYVVNQQTDLHSEIRYVLPSAAEQQVAASLETAMGGMFTDVAHDLDLSFYVDNALRYHENNVIDASSASLTFYMNQADYRHLILANVTGESQAGIDGADSDLTMTVSSAEGDTIDSHTCPMFSARTDVPLDGRDASYSADLYMINSAVALVLADGTTNPAAVTGLVDGMATSFAVNDSTYSFSRVQVTRMNEFAVEEYHCLYAATLPSRNAATGNAEDGIWQVKAYVTLDGKITENVLHIGVPLQAGCVKIIKGIIKDDGSITTESPEVGVSVTLDWKPGGNHDIEI